MSAANVVGIKHKIIALMRIVNIDAVQLQNHLAHYDIKRIRSSKWLDDSAIRINSEYRERFRRYFTETHNIDLDTDFFSMPIDVFDRYVSLHIDRWKQRQPKSNVAPLSHASARAINAGQLDNFIGCYQIIRRNTSDGAGYILEGMEIEKSHSDDGVIINTLFYSHNKPTRRFIYEGVAYAAKRYYFSLMHREHEDADGDSSFRCITFYIGDGPGDGAFSALMLRGLTDGGRNAVAIPFIAIRDDRGSDHGIHLKSAQMVSVIADRHAERIVKLHQDSSILVGRVRRKWYPAVFERCDIIIKKMDEIMLGNRPTHEGVHNSDNVNGVKYDMILRTLTTLEMERIEAADATEWDKLVHQLPINTTDPHE